MKKNQLLQDEELRHIMNEHIRSLFSNVHFDKFVKHVFLHQLAHGGEEYTYDAKSGIAKFECGYEIKLVWYEKEK